MAAAIFALLYTSAAGAQKGDLAYAGWLDQQMLQLFGQGRHADAIPLARKALEIREETLGPDHPDVAASLTSLAELYHNQGRYAEAEPLFKRNLAIYEKALGPDHPDVAGNINSLAALYGDQGRYAEAEPLFKRSSAIFEKALGPEHPDFATSLNNLAGLYRIQGRYADAEPLYKRSLAIRETALRPDDPDVASSLNNLAELYRTQGRYAEAEPLYKRSLTIREEALGPDQADVARSLNSLAGLYLDQGRHAEAEPLYKRSLAIRAKVRGPDHPDVALSLHNLATLYQKQGRHAEAEPLYKRSLAIDENALGHDHPAVATSLNHLAELYRAQSRHAEAEPLYKRSLAIYEKALGPDHPDVAAGVNNLAQLYHNQGRYAEAEPLLERSLAIQEKAHGPDHLAVAGSLDNLAELYRNQGRYAQGINFSRRAVAILSNWFGKETHTQASSHAERRSKRDYFFNNIRLVHAVAEPTAAAESFRVSQLATTSTTAQAVSGMAARFAAGTDALAAVVRERQDVAQRWQRLDGAIIKAAGQATAGRDGEAEAALRRQLAGERTRLDVLDARIAREFPAFAELSDPKPLEIAEVQALLAPGEAMLVYLVDDDASWLWALRSDRAEFRRIELGAKALSSEVAALRNRLDPELNPDMAPFDAKRAFALYEKIIAPAADLLAGAHLLFIVPDGPLEGLPPQVLLTNAPAGNPGDAAEHRNLAWLARSYALDVLPSVGALRALRRFTDTAHATKAFAGIGNPVLLGTPETQRGVKLAQLFRGTMADVTAVRRLAPLPETADELRTVAKAMGASEQDLYLAERASEPLLRRAGLERYRIIEFATHGLMSGDLAGLAEPALVLTPPPEATHENDGLLTASKIATLKLNADWVVLSACNTAAADGTPDAGGLSGLAKAFFYAGARSILVSHWSVPSQATVKLVTAAFDELTKDPTIGRAEALRRAEMAMLDPTNPPEFAHPMFWAAFVLAGEGGAGR